MASYIVPFILHALGINIRDFQWLPIINKNGLLIYSICISCFAVSMTIKVFKYRKVQMETRSVLSESYYNFLHDVRNRVGSFHVSESSNDLSITLLTEVMKKDCEEALNGLCNIYKTLSGQNVSACIKLVNNDNNDNNKRYVVTFARSTNTNPLRKANDEIRTKDYITENTDFNIIINENKAYFYQQDLIKYKNELEKRGKHYLNTTPHWEKLYRSTIVAPIRLSKTRVHSHNLESASNSSQDNTAYLIKGFLCVDSMSTDIFVNSEEKYYCHILKSYAAIFYTFFSIYSELLKKAVDSNSTDVKQ